MTQIYDPPIQWTGNIETPLVLFRTNIRPEWIDEFGHVNFVHYLSISDHPNWAFWNWINGPYDTMERRNGHENVVIEKHVRYIRELVLDEPIYVATRLIGFDEKRYVLFHEVRKTADSALAATVEAKFLGFDLNARRAESWCERVSARLASIQAVHDATEIPAASGVGISV